MPSYNEIWYAARTTQIVYMPRKLLETFGETRVTYNVVSSMEDDDGHVRLRTGLVKSARPLVLTPHYFRQQMLENFGDEAQSYFDHILSRQDNLRILQYGLCFMKQEYSEEVVGGTVADVADQLARAAQDDMNDVRGVIIDRGIVHAHALFAVVDSARRGFRQLRHVVEGGGSWAETA